MHGSDLSSRAGSKKPTHPLIPCIALILSSSEMRPAWAGQLSRMRLCTLMGMLLLTPTMVSSEPIVTGCQVLTYAAVLNPQSLALAPDGTIYAGHDSHQGDTHPDPVFRIAPGGAPVEEYGSQSFYDPDGVLYDPDGSATGIAGGLLVSDWNPGIASSALRLVHPDESVTTWADAGQEIKNPTYLVMDPTGAVWLTDDYRYQTGLLRVLNGVAEVMAAGPPFGFWGIALSPVGTIFAVANTDGTNKTIREYDLNGSLLQADFATSPSYDLLAFGNGGAFGTDLYVMSLQGGLYRLDSSGSAVQVGTGFHEPVDLKFGPDGNLYVSEDTEGRILQIIPDQTAVSPWGAPWSPDSRALSVVPNPSRWQVDVRLAVAGTQRGMGIGVYDVAGRLVRRLHSGPLAAGRHTISWDGLDGNGRHCGKGIYFVRAQAPGVRLATRIARME